MLFEYLEFRSEIHRFNPYAPYKSKIKKGMYFFFLLICKDLDEILLSSLLFQQKVSRNPIEHEIPCEAWEDPEMMDAIESQNNMYKASEESDP